MDEKDIILNSLTENFSLRKEKESFVEKIKKQQIEINELKEKLAIKENELSSIKGREILNNITKPREIQKEEIKINLKTGEKYDLTANETVYLKIELGMNLNYFWSTNIENGESKFGLKLANDTKQWFHLRKKEEKYYVKPINISVLDENDFILLSPVDGTYFSYNEYNTNRRYVCIRLFKPFQYNLVYRRMESKNKNEEKPKEITLDDFIVPKKTVKNLMEKLDKEIPIDNRSWAEKSKDDSEGEDIKK